MKLVLFILSIIITVTLVAKDDYSGSDYSDRELKNYNLSDLNSLNATILIIKRRYLEADKIEPEKMFTKALDYIERNIPNIMFEYKNDKKVTIILEDNKKVFNFTSNKTVWNVSLNLRKIFLFIESHIKDKKLLKDIELAAIDGILATLDPHTNLLRPALYTEMKMNNSGSFGGLGIVISMRENRLTVVSPIEGTPAFRAGIKSKDKIVRINDESTIGMDINQAVNRMRGAPGTNITIYVERKGWVKAKPFKLTRAIIEIKSVSSKLLKGNIAYFKIKSFQGNTSRDLRTHLEKVTKESKNSLRGIILDLRNDPGGLLSEAQYVSDIFLKEGYIVSTVGVGNDGMVRQDTKALNDNQEPKLPLIVLVNSGSASASEIVAGALKTNKRALLLGQTTFGKGSVQIIQNLGKEAVKITIAQYLINYDVSIQGIGIEPDIEVTPVKLTKDEISYYDMGLSYHESDYESILANKNRKLTSKPRINIRYLLEDKKETDDEKYYRNDLKYKEDFEIELARKLLLKGKSVNSDILYKEISKELNSSKKEQDDIIAKKLVNFKINWEAGKLLKKANLEVKFESKPIKAGEKLKVTAHVTNKGNKTIYRLRATTDSSIYFLRGIEFLFGKIEPGETVSWDASISIPKEALTQNVDLKLDFSNDDQKLKIEKSTIVRIDGISQPLYKLTYSLKDANNNGMIEKGEKIKLHVNLLNIGGNGGETNLTLKNKTSKEIFIEKGTFSQKKLMSKKAIDTDFEFTMKEKLDRNYILMDLLVYDSELKVFKKFDFKFPLKKKITGNFVLQEPVVKIDKFSNLTTDKKVTLTGTINGDIMDYYLYTASARKLKYDYDKIFFKTIKGEKRVKFNVEVPLKKGLNTISVVARKSKDFFTIKTINIYRK